MKKVKKWWFEIPNSNDVCDAIFKNSNFVVDVKQSKNIF